MALSSLVDPRDLVGTWDLARVIVDHRGNAELHMTGTAELVRGADGRIRWAESGTLDRGGSAVPVSRVLFVEERADGWFVTFEDGRDFHAWEPGREVEHQCTPDLYAGRIDGSTRRWTVEWTVTGPAKDYVMTSILTPHAS